MAESSWPLPPNQVVNDTQYEQLLQGYIPSGVMGSPGDTTIVTAPGSGTRVITIRLGKYALVRGHMWYSGTSDVNLASLAANASGNPRIDLVTLRYTRSTGAVTTVVTTGTPAASPTAPVPTQTLSTSGSFEIPIAEVAVANGATTITTGNITSRETYLSRTPIIGGATAPTATGTPGVYLGQEYHQYNSTGPSLLRWWWSGSTWKPFDDPFVAVTRAATLNVVSSAAEVAVPWDTPVGSLNAFGMWAAGNPSRLVCPWTGTYRLTANIHWTQNGTASRDLWVQKNGTTRIFDAPVAAVALAVTAQRHGFAWTFAVTASDYLELMPWQNSGSTLNLAAYPATAHLEYIGA